MEKSEEILKDTIISVNKGTIRRLAVYAFHYKYRIILAILILILAVGTELIGPFISKTIIDKHLSLIGSDAFEFKPIFVLLGVYILVLIVASRMNMATNMPLICTRLTTNVAIKLIYKSRMDSVSLAIRLTKAPIGVLSK